MSSLIYKKIPTPVNPLSANITKWSNILKQFADELFVFDHFVGLALKRLVLSNLFVEIKPSIEKFPTGKPL